jgi:hypothetical protein
MDPVNLPTRLLCILALPIFLIAGTTRSRAYELPDSPTPQAVAPTTGSVYGVITDRDGDAIPKAIVTLTRDSQPPATTTTAIDGTYIFSGLPAGAFALSITATGFAPHQTSGSLQPGEDLQLPDISLTSGSTTNIQVTATQTEIAEAQINQEEKQRVLGAIPNFYVVYEPNPVPLDPRQKYELALKTLIDPITIAFNGGIAGIEQATDTYAWQQGADGYAKRFAAGYGTLLTSDLLTGAVLPVLFKQDPRYYYKGTGSVGSRIFYALANAIVCKGDNGHWQFNYSGVFGSIAASGISNAYYPAPNRAGAALTFEGAAIGTGYAAIQNILQEFLIRKLTPHVPKTTPTAKP